MSISEHPEPARDEMPCLEPASGVEIHTPSSGFAVIGLSGGNDVSTSTRLLEALGLTRRTPNVIVDLTSCPIIGSSTMGVLFRAYETGLLGGQRVELVAPDDGAVHRILSNAGASHLLPVHETVDDALCALDRWEPV